VQGSVRSRGGLSKEETRAKLRMPAALDRYYRFNYTTLVPCRRRTLGHVHEMDIDDFREWLQC
jgi:hypothetical protein